jgi:hypothetical protein
MWAVWKGLASPTASALMPLAFSFSAAAKNSSKVAGGLMPLSARTFLLNQRTLERWMLTGTDQIFPPLEAISISCFGKTLSQPSLL